jgi:hypothetical protein
MQRAPNFSNQVPRSKVSLSEDLSLPPHIREYMHQKKFHAENHIQPSVPLEKIYGITSGDIAVLKSGKCKDQFNRASRPEAQADTWRERVSTAPLRFRTQNWNREGKNARDCALGEPGVTIFGGNINPDEIDVDSRLRGRVVSRTASSPATIMDTCLKRAVPDYRGGEVKSGLNTSFYQAVPFTGIGCGTGNMTVNNEIHFGETSRNYQDRKVTGAAIDRFEPLLRTDFQHPDSVVLPFPRGGVDTRNFDRYSRQDQSHKV